MAQEQQDVETLKRRGRRRLVGAVALVLAAVIILPMVFDPEPQGTAPSVSVRIPGEDETPFAPKPPPKKAQPTPAEQYVVQVGAFTNPQVVTAKLDSAKLPYYTEVTQGNLTRVRAGPFATREAAEQALEQLKDLGFQPGTVTPRPG
jgi:cell division septation protein DedD